jgi:hypothetical protein
MLKRKRMTNTEFIVRGKNGGKHPLLKTEEMRFGVVDGALVLGFLATFMGLVFLLAK